MLSYLALNTLRNGNRAELERAGPKAGEDLSSLRGKLASAEAATLSLGMDRGM